MCGRGVLQVHYAARPDRGQTRVRAAYNGRMSVLDSFSENTRRFPDKVAVEFIDAPLQSFTYAELDALLDRTFAYLQRLGLKRGDRVALQLPKCIEFILVHLAAIRAGAISLPLNPAYPPDELHYFLEDSGARLLFAMEPMREQIAALLPDLPDLDECVILDASRPERFRSLIDDAAASGAGCRSAVSQVSQDETAVIVYTSGTTGRPKGAEITHGNLVSNLEALHTAWGWRAEDVLLHALPIFHVHGLLVALHGALNAGATTLMMREFDARKVLELLASGVTSVFMAVPTIHRRLLDVPDAKQFDLSDVRLITSGSDRLPDEVFTGFRETYGYTLLERYGMTETGMICSNPLHGQRRIGSVGPPLPGIDVRIVHPETRNMLPDGEIGELEIRGPNVLKGYWRQPDKTTAAFSADGWFKTGDLGFREADGYITLCGRSKDLIISGGLNIYPPEVERVLVEHPAVSTCAVIGCPDSEWGERVTAVVVLNPDQAVSEADLIAFCRERLAPYKSPKVVAFADDLPRNAMGKVQKAGLRGSVCSGVRS